MSDPYLEAIYQSWPHIVTLYEAFADKRPVMLFDIQEQRIYALPYWEYRAGLSKRSQASLKERELSAGLRKEEADLFLRGISPQDSPRIKDFQPRDSVPGVYYQDLRCKDGNAGCIRLPGFLLPCLELRDSRF